MTLKAAWNTRKEAIGVANELTLKTQEQHRATKDPKNKCWRVYNATKPVWTFVDSEGNPI